ncbi:hypothetical protein ABS642_00775 [Microbacterium sp. A8/3-1]|uniref:Head-to-tail adaptor n=1 Tax=Microbacterium sp. A8/3-1 TaxID=3160749 RepID=A0AAU7VY40_9MICO
MVMRVYATAADYAAVAEEAWDGDAPTLLKRLRAASVEVERITRRARYDVDEDGFPTDVDIADAFTEATCAIGEYWGITDDVTGAEAVAGAVKIGSVSLGTTSSSQEALSAQEKLERRIGTRATDILLNAGLLQAAIAHT